MNNISVLHIVQNNGITNMGYNDFYLFCKNKFVDCVYLFEDGVDRGLIKSFFLFSKMFYKHLKDANVIHYHSHQLVIISQVINKLSFFNIKSIYTIHTSYENLKGKNKLLFLLNFFLVNKVVFCSKSSYLSFPKIIRENKKSCYIVNGVDFEIKPFDNIKYGFISVGRLISLKRIVNVISIYLSGKFKNKLNVVGAGDKSTEIKEMLKGNYDVNIHGLLPRHEVLKLLLKSKYYISYSSIEGMPISVLEAISMGCVPILSNIEPHNEIFSMGIKGFIVNNENELKNALVQCELMTDFEFYNIIDNNIIVLKNEFSLKTMHEKYYREYAELLL
ncbi:hypothetical protein BTO22_18225 [Aliivibrio sifiae]|uniref:Glycosyl transferase family 1 domain-containing protein n=2 Tax=Aliivibrio sifiae TaxID=566293 RepID=A0A2S7X0N0_9GAMM|nr:hypothetical protein BTO22_18225 [Aliivibrio sifiae]